MQELDFTAIYAVEQVLECIPLEHLVAVLTKAVGHELLLVYNSEACPLVSDEHWRVVSLQTLAELPREEIERYDGMLVSVSALDVICQDLVTKGARFYPLERLLNQLNQRDIQRRTLRGLAEYLTRLLPSWSAADQLANPVRYHRLEFKIVELALPALLHERQVDGLIALQTGPLHEFVAGQVAGWVTVADYDPLQPLTDDQGWLVAFTEVRSSELVPYATERFLDLRPVLRYTGFQAVLEQTCRDLAYRCRAAAATRPELLEQAWALLAETWLAREDVQDLVALLPHPDFDHFARHGEGLRIYRELDAAVSPTTLGPSWTLSELERCGLPALYQARAYTLIPLGLPEQATFELGTLLWKAGHDVRLAQTLLLLAHDGLDGAPLVGKLEPQTFTNLARRALFLVSLGNPWVWPQGRYQQMIDSIYQALTRALQRQIMWAKASHEVGLATFYETLGHWLAGSRADSSDEIVKLLRSANTAFRTFLHLTRERKDELQLYRANAQLLIDVEEAALYPSAIVRSTEVAGELQLGALPNEMETTRYVATRRMLKGSWLSPVFKQAWDALSHLRSERQQVEQSEHNIDMLHQRLSELLVTARRQRKLLFAPPHEQVVLDVVYQREIDDLEEHIRSALTEARLQIRPLIGSVERERVVRLPLEVRNIGRAEARDVDVVLVPNSSFELLDTSSVVEFAQLGPGVPHRFNYNLRPLHETELSLDFVYTYGNSDGKFSFRLRVHDPEGLRFTLKSDPYKFGRAIQNPDDFYGREHDIRVVFSALQGGGHTNFMLRGPRRMGKTSLLYMLQEALRIPDIRRRFNIPATWDTLLNYYTPVMLDLQAFTFQEGAAPAAHFFYALLDAICKAIEPERRSELLLQFEQRRQNIDDARSLLEQLELIFQRQPRVRVVVLLDEYDEIYRPQGQTLDSSLRHVVQTEQHLTWVIASTQFLYKEGKSYGSPWFNIFHIIELNRLPEQAAQLLIKQPGRSEGIEWQPEAIRALMDETGCHPAFLQLFGSKIVDDLNRDRRNYVDIDTIKKLADEIVEGRGTIHSHFEFYWTDTPGIGRLILLHVDENGRPTGSLELKRRIEVQLRAHFGARLAAARVTDATGNPVVWWEKEFKEGIMWVSEIVNALSYDRTSRTYSFSVPLFRRWLRRIRRSEQLEEDAFATVAKEMERDGVA